MAESMSQQDARNWLGQRMSGLTDRQATLLARFMSNDITTGILTNDETEELGVALGGNRQTLDDVAEVWRGAYAPPNQWDSRGARVDGVIKKLGDPTKAPGAKTPQSEAAGKEKATISGQIQAFVDSMLGPLDPNDPIRQSLIQSGTDAAQRSSANAGLSARSGLAGTQAASTVQANIAPYEAQRKALGLQGQGLLSGRDISLGQLELAKIGLENAKAGAEWDAQQNQNQAIGSLVGSGVGALGYIWGPAVGGATMAAGGAIGGGLGGLAGGGGGPNYRTGPRSLGAGNSGGGSGKNPFTGY